MNLSINTNKSSDSQSQKWNSLRGNVEFLLGNMAFEDLPEEKKMECKRLVIGLLGIEKLKKFIEAVQLKDFESTLNKQEKQRLIKALELLKEKDLLVLLNEAFVLYTDANGEPNQKFIEEFDASGHLKCLKVETPIFSREKSALLILLLLLIELSHERWLDMNKYSMLINEKTKLSTKKIVELMQSKAGYEWWAVMLGAGGMVIGTVGAGIIPGMNPYTAQAIGQAAGQALPVSSRYKASIVESETHYEQSEKELLRFLQEKLSGFKSELDRNKEQTFQQTERVIGDKKNIMQTIAGRIVV